MTGPRRFRRSGLRGPWRIAVVEGSMLPAIESGDWLLVDPTTGAWPRRGTAVVFREPGSGELAIKRVAARPGDWVPFTDGYLQLGADEAWLIGDATDEALADAGYGPAVDSRVYGPVPLEALVARAWLRYWPRSRIGRIARLTGNLIERGREGRVPVAPDARPEVPLNEGRPASGVDGA
ncbi:MAG: S26 family signal peptidase [Candidatus Limnocylindrales bacterium]